MLFSKYWYRFSFSSLFKVSIKSFRLFRTLPVVWVFLLTIYIVTKHDSKIIVVPRASQIDEPISFGFMYSLTFVRKTLADFSSSSLIFQSLHIFASYFPMVLHSDSCAKKIVFLSAIKITNLLRNLDYPLYQILSWATKNRTLCYTIVCNKLQEKQYYRLRGFYLEISR